MPEPEPLGRISYLYHFTDHPKSTAYKATRDSTRGQILDQLSVVLDACIRTPMRLVAPMTNDPKDRHVSAAAALT